ncbi:hypothetical protein, partial [Vibrio anguillarum]
QPAQRSGSVARRRHDKRNDRQSHKCYVGESMKQLYALIKESSYSAFYGRFPDAVQFDGYRLGVFVDNELDGVTGLADDWAHFDGSNVVADLTVCTYEQAKLIVSEFNKESEL